MSDLFKMYSSCTKFSDLKKILLFKTISFNLKDTVQNENLIRNESIFIRRNHSYLTGRITTT